MTKIICLNLNKCICMTQLCDRDINAVSKPQTGWMFTHVQPYHDPSQAWSEIRAICLLRLFTCPLAECTAACCLCGGQRRCGTSVQETGHSHDSQQSPHLPPSFHPAHPPPAGSQETIISISSNQHLFSIHSAEYDIGLSTCRQSLLKSQHFLRNASSKKEKILTLAAPLLISI